MCQIDSNHMRFIRPEVNNNLVSVHVTIITKYFFKPLGQAH